MRSEGETIMKLRTIKIFFGAAFILFAAAIFASAQTKKVNVSFKTGATGGDYSNTVAGNGSVDYYITAKAGQRMSAKLTSANSSLYFLVTKSGGTESIADDARDATEWSGDLPDNGTYVVRVYLFRNAARTNKKPVSFKIRFDVN